VTPVLLSINVGLPRLVTFQGELVETAIFKEPVTGPVQVGRLNLEGDRQADLSVHGGRDKAVYVYPAEHYPLWREELGADLGWGAFGENLTVSGLTEDDVRIGDRLRIGSAEFVVTQPRTPCYKLNVRFSRPDMVRRFHRSGRSGFYLAVTQEGVMTAGDGIVVSWRDAEGVSVADIVRRRR
jgi:MOSC domain-containing protein YiiM